MANASSMGAKKSKIRFPVIWDSSRCEVLECKYGSILEKYEDFSACDRGGKTTRPERLILLPAELAVKRKCSAIQPPAASSQRGFCYALYRNSSRNVFATGICGGRPRKI